MKSGWRTFIVAVIVSLIIRTAQAQAFSLTSVSPTNSLPVNLGTNSDEMGKDGGSTTDANSPAATKFIPLIQFEDVPLTIAVENLARQAGINYILDPQIDYHQPDQDGQIMPEPTLTVRWTAITAEEGFERVCTNYDLVIVRDPAAHVVLLRKRGHDVNFVSPDIYNNSKDTNIIPLIEFQEVPLFIGLKNLVRQAGLKCIFSPRVESSRQIVDLRWEKITATQALAAICENYDLKVTRYPESGVIEIGPND
jgi:hypothetical protein